MLQQQLGQQQQQLQILKLLRRIKIQLEEEQGHDKQRRMKYIFHLYSHIHKLLTYLYLHVYYKHLNIVDIIPYYSQFDLIILHT
jgi:hypothetical protein